MNPAHREDETDTARCTHCGKTKPHTIARLNRDGWPVLCDTCHRDLPTQTRRKGK